MAKCIECGAWKKQHKKTKLCRPCNSRKSIAIARLKRHCKVVGNPLVAVKL